MPLKCNQIAPCRQTHIYKVGRIHGNTLCREHSGIIQCVPCRTSSGWTWNVIHNAGHVIRPYLLQTRGRHVHTMTTYTHCTHHHITTANGIRSTADTMTAARHHHRNTPEHVAEVLPPRSRTTNGSTTRHDTPTFHAIHGHNGRGPHCRPQRTKKAPHGFFPVGVGYNFLFCYKFHDFFCGFSFSRFQKFCFGKSAVYFWYVLFCLIV